MLYIPLEVIEERQPMEKCTMMELITYLKTGRCD